MTIEEKELLRERYELSMGRIKEIVVENTLSEPLQNYFRRVAGFILQIKDLLKKKFYHELEDLSFKEYQTLNYDLYQDILPENYENSYANPTYAIQKLGEEYGSLLSFVYTEFRAMIADAYEGNEIEIVSACELFIELYNLFEAKEKREEIFGAVYWYLSDYSDVVYAKRILSSYDPSFDFARKIVMERDLNDLRYLFAYGEFISDAEIKTAVFLNGLSEDIIQKMADTFVEGYRKGFEIAGIDLSKKKVVQIRYPIGFERVIRQAIIKFSSLGLESVLFRYALHSVGKNRELRVGYTATPANRQYDYDHRQDEGLYLDKAFYERKLSVLKTTYEKNEALLRQYAGPAVLETFGEKPFAPVYKPECAILSPKQQKLELDYITQSSQLFQQYIPSKDVSFTIIAFPTPQIGEYFEEIFQETIRINTLDDKVYQKIQQCLIDALDQAEYVRIIGRNGNHTNLKVCLTELKDREKETKFENCLSDVNIPLGEVFTSPKLSGTEGILHVKEVFLQGLSYLDLTIEFKDGRISHYNCKNFETEEENQAYFQNTIMHGRDTLPMGEFAIGTNTTAYAMAKKYHILHLLPILIVEKMGPHFAVGDTCYNRQEEIRVYNPDGKEMIAKENEFSLLRKTDPDRAYFNCHTDITIPYEEIGEIACYTKEGKKIELISEGRFVLKGTELLNKAW